MPDSKAIALSLFIRLERFLLFGRSSSVLLYVAFQRLGLMALVDETIHHLTASKNMLKKYAPQ